MPDVVGGSKRMHGISSPLESPCFHLLMVGIGTGNIIHIPIQTLSLWIRTSIWAQAWDCSTALRVESTYHGSWQVGTWFAHIVNNERGDDNVYLLLLAGAAVAFFFHLFGWWAIIAVILYWVLLNAALLGK